MDCCQSGLNALFDAKEVQQKLARYRKHGPERGTRVLLNALISRGVAEHTVLDIGGGIGALSLGLLRAGAARAEGIDISTAYVAAANAEAAHQGFAERAKYRQGDAVALGSELAPADIVTLDRVVCCYPDMPALLGVAAARATRMLGLVYPRDAWWMHGVRALINGVCWLQRSTFRFFVHPTAAIDAQLRAAGMEQAYHANAGPWQVALYTRVG